ncbi:putative methyltransferase YqeM, partial [Pseudocercospora fuligena]
MAATETTTSKPLNAAELFDSVGKPYEEAFRDVPGQQRSLKWLISTLPPHSKILDIGCGTGRPACEMLSNAGHEVTGIDVSSVMVDTIPPPRNFPSSLTYLPQIETARSAVPTAKFHQANILAWTPPHIYDAIIIYFSLISSITQSEIREAFKKLYSLLSPGGVFIFGTVVVECEMKESKWMGRDCVVSGLSVEGNLEGIKEAGFEVIKFEEEVFVPKGVEAGLCEKGDVWEEPMLYVYARKEG